MRIFIKLLSLCFCIYMFCLFEACQKEEENVVQETQAIASSASLPSFVDARDGNRYTYVSIGDQVWMAENLKYLPTVIGPDSASYALPLYYVYDYLGNSVSEAMASSNFQTYGVLYNYAAAVQGGPINPEIPDQIKGVCPVGWHLPTDEEWTRLTDFLGGKALAGGKLKVSDTLYWKSPNRDATNETEFSAMPGGFKTSNGEFIDLQINGFWWSSTSNSQTLAWFRNMYYLYGDVYRIDFNKDAGFCVRCVQD